MGVGPLHHFGWSALPAAENSLLPFSATVTAQDVANNTVSSFTGTVSLSGYIGTGTGSTIVITEVNTNTPDEIEFMNVSTSPVDISGWTIYVYDVDVWPSAKTFTIPAGTVCAAGQIFRLQEYGTSPGAFPLFFYGDNIDWTSDSASEVAVLLRNASGAAVDFMCAAQGTPSSISFPQTIPTAQWSGATIAAPANSTFAYARIGNSDGNKATDWTTATPGLGTVNPGLTVPFPAPTTPVTISPTVSTNFANGTWTGNISVLQIATQMRLHASDGANHTGDSAPFNSVGSAILGVIPAGSLSASGTVGGPFSPLSAGYTVSNSGNIAMSWTASNNASWLTVSPASGTLGVGGTVPVTATINSNAAALSVGSYNDTITFTNTGGSFGNATRPAALSVLTLPAPSLAPLPTYSGGTSTTVSWNSVAGANLYEVQAATDAAFTSPRAAGGSPRQPSPSARTRTAPPTTIAFTPATRHPSPIAPGAQPSLRSRMPPRLLSRSRRPLLFRRRAPR